MTTRQRLATVFLWGVLVFVGTMFGASVYQRISLIPEWGGDLPQSVVSYFRGTTAGQAIDRFWTSVTGPTALVILAATIFNWPFVARRRWISRGALLFLAMLVWTFAYFVPKGVVPLMLRGGEGLTPEAITSSARAWIFWDWFRMAGTLAAFLCFVQAISLPSDPRGPAGR